MFDTIIILAGPVEQVALAAVLRAHNAEVAIRLVGDAASLASIEQRVLARARLIGFATGVIVPADTLEQLGYGAYNFHPGPPEFPGLSPAQYAVYNRALRFGVTAHKMAELVDSGPIVGVELFDIRTDITVEQLELLSYEAIARLFWKLAPLLATEARPLGELPVRWSKHKSSRRSYAALCNIAPDISFEELERRIAAFGGGYFGQRPTITLHGYQFQFVPVATGGDPQPTDQIASAPSLTGAGVDQVRQVNFSQSP